MTNKPMSLKEAINTLREIAKGDDAEAKKARKLLAAFDNEESPAEAVSEREIRAMVARIWNEDRGASAEHKPTPRLLGATSYSPRASELDRAMGLNRPAQSTVEGSRLVLRGAK